MSESTKEVRINPDGRLDPHFYDKLTFGEGGELKEREIVQIVETGIAYFPYKAIDPQTGEEKPLEVGQWKQVYVSLNKVPPHDLPKRVRLYYQSTPVEIPT